MSAWKRITTIFMALIMLLTSGVQAFAGTSLETALNKVNLYVKQDTGAQLLTWKGMIDPTNFAAAIIVYKAEDGKEYPAFCANPNRGGVENFASKNYDVDVDQLDSDPHVWGVITNGYPYKTPEELGVKTVYEAYYATKMAVWAVVHDNYSNLDDWKANGSQNAHVETAMKNLVAKGLANQYVYKSWLAVNPQSQLVGTDSIDGDYISQTYTLKSNVDIRSYRVVIDNGVPDGAKVTDVNNNEKTEFDGSETTFKVLIPAEAAEDGGEFRVLVKGKLENKAVMFGIAHDAEKQDYYVAPLPSYNGDSWVQLVYGESGDITPDEPEDSETSTDTENPTVPDAGEGLQILKVKKGTTEGLEGAVFKVAVDGKVIGYYVTDENGEILIPDITGNVSITEEVPPVGYVLDENNHKDVVIGDADEPTVVTFANEEMAQLEVMKVDADTGEALAGAAIRVAYDGGHDSYDVYTNASGRATLTNLKSGTYTVTEIAAPDGYILNNTPQTIKLEPGKTATITLTNEAKPGIVIKKYDEDTGMPLENAEFSVAKKGGSIVYEGITDKSGQIRVEDLAEGWYTITELAAPSGYLIATESKDVYLEPNETVEVKFDNRLRPSLQIMKLDSQTQEPLAGTKFKVTKTEDKTVSEYVTDETGTAIIRDLDEAVYTVEEVTAPDGYCLDAENHKDIALEWGKTKTLIFEDTKKPTLIVTKTNALTEKPAPGTVFKIQRETADGGVVTLGTYKTDENGQIIVKDTEPGWYVITEVRAAQGMSLPSDPVTRKYLAPGENAYDVDFEASVPTSSGNSSASTVKVTSGIEYTIGEEITNYPLNSIVIKKTDANTSELLAGAVFEVRKVSEDISGNSGTIIGRYTTDNSGIIVITGLEAGAYIIEEVNPPANYLLSENSKQQAWLKADGTSVVEVVFTNYPYGSLLISKVDAETNKPLAGAKFKVTDSDGTVVGNANGEYTTDNNGEILISNLKPGSYIATELEAPDGYVRDDTPKTIDIGTDGKTYRLEFKNSPLSGIKIIKTDSETNEPLEGVSFVVSKLNGEKVGTFKTDNEGMIYISVLEDGWYTVTETKGLEGYHWDKEPRMVEVKSGKETIVEVENEPYSCLVIEKTNSKNDKPIEGVEFLVTKLNGEEIGYYETDESGLIVIEGLEEGSYLVKETEAAKGFILDSEAKEVKIRDGERTTLKVENDPMYSILIHKIDSVTGEGIYGVKFLLYDSDNDPIGQFETDDEGYIYINKELPEGKYKLRELEPAEGYIADDEVKTFYVKKGKTTEIEWENTPEVGQIVVTKRSSEYNELTGLPAGSPLEGAVFEIYNITGNLVDKITSNSNGVAASKGLPVGVYVVKEVSAPSYYALNTRELLAEIRHNGDIVRFEVLNSSISLDLSIQKKGPNAASPGQIIKYDLYEVENGSSGVLENFYIHDRIPTDATRVLKVVTGTYSERMYYKITYKTNYRDYRTLADNLLTKNSYEYSLHPNVLGLANGEYVTDIRLEFPKASPGFKMVENMSVYCQVLPNMPKDYRITNRADVGGRYGNEWESAKTSWNTSVWNIDAPTVKLPKTGY